MNYFVPPQGGIPGVYQPQMAALQQVQVNPSLTPQVNYYNGATPSPQLHMLAPMGAVAAAPQMQQAQLMQPRMVQASPVAQAAQLSQVNAHYALQAQVAASQYQAVQAARQQAAAQRAITSLASMRQAQTRTPPVTYTTTTPVKKDTVDAEVQTPEADVNPEADSSTKPKIITSILANCSALVSSHYHHLQSRILTWGEKQDRQALELSRIRSDVEPSASVTTPTTIASVILFDDGTLQFCVSGKVIKSMRVVAKEDTQMDDRALREYLDNLGDLYTFCCGLSEADLSNACMATFYKNHNLLIRVTDPFPRAVSPNCAKWFKIGEIDAAADARCPACSAVLKKLKKINRAGSSNLILGTAARKRKHQATINLEDIPTEPQTKKPKISTATLMQELGVLQQQVLKFHDSPASENPMVVGKFLESLGKDLDKVRSAAEENGPEEEYEEEVEEMPEDGEKQADEPQTEIQSEIQSETTPGETQLENDAEIAAEAPDNAIESQNDDIFDKSETGVKDSNENEKDVCINEDKTEGDELVNGTITEEVQQDNEALESNNVPMKTIEAGEEEEQCNENSTQVENSTAVVEDATA